MNIRSVLCSCAAAVFLLLPLAAVADFIYTDFSDTTGLQLLESAQQVGSAIRITPTSGYPTDRGAVWSTTMQQVGSGFSTQFQFSITDAQPEGGEGFAFVIQAWDYLGAIGDGGDALGYGRMGSSLAIEFDTLQDPFDPPTPHVSVQTRWTDSNGNSPDHLYSLGSTAAASINDGQVHTVRIDYTAGTLAVYLDDLNSSLLTISAVDLAMLNLLPGGEAKVGFTSGLDAQSNIAANHDILNWSYQSTVPEPASCLMLVVGLPLLALRKGHLAKG